MARCGLSGSTRLLALSKIGTRRGAAYGQEQPVGRHRRVAGYLTIAAIQVNGARSVDVPPSEASANFVGQGLRSPLSRSVPYNHRVGRRVELRARFIGLRL